MRTYSYDRRGSRKGTFYRIQPKGKPLKGWRSKDMDGNPINGTFVFDSLKRMEYAIELWGWKPGEFENSEVLEIRYDGPLMSHLIESGILIDVDQARVVRRTPLKRVLPNFKPMF